MEGSSLLVGAWGGSPAAKLSCLLRLPSITVPFPHRQPVCIPTLNPTCQRLKRVRARDIRIARAYVCAQG